MPRIYMKNGFLQEDNLQILKEVFHHLTSIFKQVEFLLNSNNMYIRFNNTQVLVWEVEKAIESFSVSIVSQGITSRIIIDAEKEAKKSYTYRYNYLLKEQESIEYDLLEIQQELLKIQQEKELIEHKVIAEKLLNS